MPQLAFPSLAVFKTYFKVRVEVWCWALTTINYVACLETSKLEVPGFVYLYISMPLTLLKGGSWYLVHKVNPDTMNALIMVCSTASINSSIFFSSTTGISDEYCIPDHCMTFLSSLRPITSAWCLVAATAPLAPDLAAITLTYNLMVEEHAGHPLTTSVSLSKLYGPE